MNTANLYIPGTKILDQRHTEITPEDGALGFTRMFVQWEKDADGNEVARGIDDATRTAEFFISSGEIDRYGEIVDPKAFDEEAIAVFMQNPVMLAAHQHSGLSGEPTVIGRWMSIRRDGNRIIGTCRFNTSKLGEEYWQLVRSGDLRACSIGFIVRAWEMREVGTGDNKRSVRVFVKIELIEVSMVAVPANRQALLKAAGFGGIVESMTLDVDPNDSDLQQQIQRAVDQSIAKTLSPEPGSELCLLIQSVVEQTLRSQGNHGQVKTEGDEDAQEILDAVERMLRSRQK